jgi:undecaprenyl diphosphate synthase
VGLIMDGNGRWATARGLPRTEGHRQGSLSAERLVRFLSKEKLVPYVTLFAFSTENWSRPKREIEFLFRLLEGFIERKLAELAEAGVRLRLIGDPRPLPSRLRRAIERAIGATVHNEGLNLTIALNFGGRWAILEGVRRALTAGLAATGLDEATFRGLMPTGELPELDLVIRTGGHKRLSNFFLWEAAYAELYFTETLWPDFDERAFLEALLDFQNRTRNFGRVVA